MSVTFLPAAVVKDLLKSPERPNILVVDVRDEDYVKGHIVGCINFPVDNFEDKQEIDSFIQRAVLPPGFATVIVHCYMSQQRGPMCAKRLASRLQAMELDEPKVCVLVGGFAGFNKLYGDDPELIVPGAGCDVEVEGVATPRECDSVSRLEGPEVEVGEAVEAALVAKVTSALAADDVVVRRAVESNLGLEVVPQYGTAV